MRARTARALAILTALLALSVPVESQDKGRALDALLAAYHEAGAFNGAALVAEHGTIILKKGYGLADFEWTIPNTPDTKFRLGSITKQFTATLVLQLVGEGRLSLDTTLADALPYYRRDTGARITIHQLLNHTSGIPSYTGLPTFMSDVSRDPYGVRAFVEQYCSGDLEFEPGASYRYNNSGYFILGAIIEQLTGKPYARVLRERILDPLGMGATGYDLSGPILEKRAHGYEQRLSGVVNAGYLDMSLPFAAGSLYSTVEDLYTWDQALYGETVLPAEAKEKMFTPGLSHYGYGWTIQTQPIGPDRAERLTIGHGGGINGFSSLIVRVPDDRHLVVLLNNTGGTNLGAMFSGIADVLYGRTPPPPRQPVARVLYETIRASGVAAAVARYREIKASGSAGFDLDEAQLNRLGYELLGDERTADAIEILTLNVEAFPDSGNAHDSLAEAYLKAGQTAQAIKHYARALELDPTNRNAVEKLNELVKRRP